MGSIKHVRNLLAAAACLALPAAARAQYETPVNPPDPAAQLAEMIALYDSVCLRAFPNDEAAARDMATRGAVPMSDAEVRSLLRDDPGRGWNVAGRTARFRVTIEGPPFHACGVRTMAAAAFPDMAPYRALAARFEAGGAYRSFGPQSMVVDNVDSTAAGERRDDRGRTESLMVFLGTPVAKLRDAAHSAVEIRFVHQIYAPH